MNTIYFSPTGTTETVVNVMAKNFDATTINQINLTKPDFAFEQSAFNSETLTIIGMPVYSGRLPLDAVVRFLNINGKGTRAIVVVVYGNREYDDALLELTELAQKANFQVIAAAAFIGEHSYSTPGKPIAANRPDANDMSKVAEFTSLIRKKLRTSEADALTNLEQIPGNHPFVERKQRSALAPVTDKERCNFCGICVESCPTGAIRIENGLFTDAERCIWCCACVKKCPEQARKFDHETIQNIREKLYTNCQTRKEPQLFL